MEPEKVIISTQDIEKKNAVNEDNSDNFRKLIGQIITEIILKRKKNERRWIYKDK